MILNILYIYNILYCISTNSRKNLIDFIKCKKFCKGIIHISLLLLLVLFYETLMLYVVVIIYYEK